MYLQDRLRRLPTISLYVGVMLAMVSILSLSFLAFHLIADRMQRIEIDPTFFKFDELQLESARTALQHRGQPDPSPLGDPDRPQPFGKLVTAPHAPGLQQPQQLQHAARRLRHVNKPARVRGQELSAIAERLAH